jgi:hypothetical protein
MLKPVERAELSKALRELKGFHAAKQEGGAVLFNMKNVFIVYYISDSPVSPERVWEIECLSKSDF